MSLVASFVEVGECVAIGIAIVGMAAFATDSICGWQAPFSMLVVLDDGWLVLLDVD